MSHRLPRISWELQTRIDRICDAFESAWQSGSHPDVHEHLARASDEVPDEESRSRLFDELVAIDWVYRRRLNGRLTVEAYAASFAEDAGRVCRNLAVHGSDRPSADVALQHGSTARLGETLVSPETSSDASDGSSGELPRPGGCFGDYQIIELLGRGGVCAVFRARQVSTRREVALKLIRPDRLRDVSEGMRRTTLERFRREAQAAACVEHDHLVTVYEVGVLDDQPFYSMQYIEGRSLADHLKDGPLDNRRAASYLWRVAQAIAHVHDQGMVHRDLKPNNVLINRSDRPFVADFGMVKLLELDESLTVDGPGMGTPSFMAPEQARNAGDAGPATDVYGVGATLYAAITGRPPFQSGDAVTTIRQVLDEEPIAPRQLNATAARGPGNDLPEVHGDGASPPLSVDGSRRG